MMEDSSVIHQNKLVALISLNTDFTLHSNQQKYEIEVGGKSKMKKQIRNLENGLVFKDGIEMGSGNVIPLYLIGFLY